MARGCEVVVFVLSIEIELLGDELVMLTTGELLIEPVPVVEVIAAEDELL